MGRRKTAYDGISKMNLPLRKLTIFSLLLALAAWGAVGVYLLYTEKVQPRKEPLPTPSPVSITIADLPQPTLPAKLQKGLKETRFDDEEGVSFIHGRIETIEESVATIVTPNSRSVVRLNQLPLYQAETVEFSLSELVSSDISEFKVESEVVIVYNYLGHPEKIVLIKS